MTESELYFFYTIMPIMFFCLTTIIAFFPSRYIGRIMSLKIISVFKMFLLIICSYIIFNAVTFVGNYWVYPLVFGSWVAGSLVCWFIYLILFILCFYCKTWEFIIELCKEISRGFCQFFSDLIEEDRKKLKALKRKREEKRKILNFFSNIKNKTDIDLKKIHIIVDGMSGGIELKELKKLKGLLSIYEFKKLEGALSLNKLEKFKQDE